ncbi:nucleotidyltransferase [Tenacibaculum phage PTm1]|uniref:Nucleotidyltransferase n=2 Tax=Shirahamavirus PTm1 TaxID=2846435 RepID=A0A5S9HY45_9CAUD|nr:nucleotidyltransferase [Tenacibaculum phage PTm1]BBI90542.1 nucleotidyltransferase [Tenacibaculum phage PTm1]BBI90850.1 nucleotidyltransferase [Tenacibaculum phage PTm5]
MSHENDPFKIKNYKVVRGHREFDILFETVVGSVAYGTNVDGSDIDIKGVFLQPLSDQLLYGKIQQIVVDKDTVYYELSRVIELISVGNPTMLEMLFMPNRCIRYMTKEFREVMYNDDTRRSFITMNCRKSFCGYAYQQIKKASGLNKLMNFEKDGYFSEPKDVLDFCYVFNDRLGITEPVKDLLYRRNPHARKQENYGLVKCNHTINTFFVYYFNESMEKRPSGFIGSDSNELRTSLVPKGMQVDFIVQFNHGAYKEHKKKHKQYKTWIKERNTQRYVDSKTHGQKIDGKNLLHCVRLIEMGRELAEQRWMNVERPNAKELIKIRKGEVNLSELLDKSEKQLREVEDVFRESKLPKNVSPKLVRDIKTKFYL